MTKFTDEETRKILEQPEPFASKSIMSQDIYYN